jgi:YVTN family beta-propeller protein
MRAPRSKPVRGLFVSVLSVIGVMGSLPVSFVLAQPAGAAAAAWSAYVASEVPSAVSVIDTATNTLVGSPISVGKTPEGMAITPKGTTVYVANYNSKSVSVIDTATNTVVGSPIRVGTQPFGVAITPDGAIAYVVNDVSNNVSVIDTATNKVTTSISVGISPFAVAVTPDGTTAYVVNYGPCPFPGCGAPPGTISVIDTATNTVVGSPIQVGEHPYDIAVTPDGSTAYVTNLYSNTVSVIDTATNTVVGSPIQVGPGPTGIAITPDGGTAYVTNFLNGPDGTVSVIDTATKRVTGSILLRGGQPLSIAITPNGTTAYVVDNNGAVWVIDTATNTVVGSPIRGSALEIPLGISITPDQAPVAHLSVTPAPAGSATTFDASASTVAFGTIATYAWNFGDGSSATTTTPTTAHTYSSHGKFTASVTETSSGGTSTTKVFTGQTVSRNGGPSAKATATFRVHPCASLCRGHG